MQRSDTPNIEYLSRIPLFEALPRESIASIARDSHIRLLKKKEMLYFQGDPAEKCYLLLHGAVKIYLETAKSNESVISVASGRQVLGDIAIHEGARFLTSAQVVEDAEVLAIPASILRSYMKTHSQLATNLLKSISYEMHKLVRQMEHQTVMTAPQRVGCFLLKLYRQNHSSPQFGLPYEKRVVAAQLQMSPETFSRALDTLKEHGVTMDHATVHLADPKGLSEYACSACSRIPIPGEEFSCSGGFAPVPEQDN